MTEGGQHLHTMQWQSKGCETFGREVGCSRHKKTASTAARGPCLGLYKALKRLAGVQGFEPQLPDPESGVLPLDDTPTSAQKKAVLPILFDVRHLSLPDAGRRRLGCRLLAGLTGAAAMRANEVVVAQPDRLLPPMSPPHTPCSPSASAVA